MNIDTSNLDPCHLCCRTERKNIPEMLKYKIVGHTIWEFVALRSKLYDEDKEIIKAKFVSRTMIKNYLCIEDYKACLFKGVKICKPALNPFGSGTMIKSYKHKIKTPLFTKLSLNHDNGKRVI